MRFDASSVMTSAISSQLSPSNPTDEANIRVVSAARFTSSGPAIGRAIGPAGTSTLLIPAPLLRCNGGALTDAGFDVHFVHEPFGTRQAEPKPCTCGITLLHGDSDICNP